MSWPITLADRPAMMLSLAVHPDHVDPARSHTLVWAPCCGRRTPADTIVSLQGLTTEIRGGNYLPKRDHDWACDACLHLLIADQSNGWTWSNLFTALGAPDAVVRHHLALEVLKEAERDASRRMEWLKPGEIYDSAYANLPPDLSADLATMRPDV